jgi:hypothetical protein
MASEHRLIEYESDFSEDGYYAICSCGWKSLNAPTMTAAAELHADHATAKEK